ncbi:MAG TPA: GFA family protein [Gaiellaceae bacterium]|nr:GFA family protein [Gaiellaceae bacterium]
MPELPLTGGCLCGAVRFEVDELPLSASYCHCWRCQRRTGTAASVSTKIVPGSLRVLSGADALGAFEPADGFAKVYCIRCGGHLWSRDPTDPTALSVRMGAFDGDPGIRPSYRQFVAYAAPWEPIPDDGLPRYPERRPAVS